MPLFADSSADFPKFFILLEAPCASSEALPRDFATLAAAFSWSLLPLIVLVLVHKELIYTKIQEKVVILGIVGLWVPIVILLTQVLTAIHNYKCGVVITTVVTILLQVRGMLIIIIINQTTA